MVFVHNNLMIRNRNVFPMQTATGLMTSRAQTMANRIKTAEREELNGTIPVVHRKPVVFKPIVRDSTNKHFSNSNHPTIIYDSAPLDNVLENLSFKKKQKDKKNIGVKLVI